jgi:hypothetical protein
VEHSWESWFYNKDLPQMADPDWMKGVRVSHYANWIAGICPEKDFRWLIGDINGNGAVDLGDVAVLAGVWLNANCGRGNDYCDGADLLGDGKIDLADFEIFAGPWLGH